MRSCAPAGPASPAAGSRPRRCAPAEGAAAAPGPAERRGAAGAPGGGRVGGCGGAGNGGEPQRPRLFSPSPFPCFHRDAASPSGVAFPELARATLSARRGGGGAGRGVLRCLPEQFQPVGVWQSLKEVGKAASLSGRARTSSTAGSSSQQQQSQSVQPPPPPHCRGGEGSQGTMTS